MLGGVVIGRIGLGIRNSNVSGTRDELSQRELPLISPFRVSPGGTTGTRSSGFLIGEETFVFPPPVNEAGPAASSDSGKYFSSFAVFDVNLDVTSVGGNGFLSVSKYSSRRNCRGCGSS